jgi:hypothetical protein
MAFTITRKVTYVNPLDLDNGASRQAAPLGGTVQQIAGDVKGDSSNVKAQKEMILSLPEKTIFEDDDLLIICNSSDSGKLYKIKGKHINDYINRTVDYDSSDYNLQDYN